MVLTNSLKMTLVWIPPGEFQMGAEEDREATLKHFSYWNPKWLDGEEPRHTVRITKPFYMGQYEVTLGQFKRFCRAARYQTDVERGRLPARGYVQDGRLIESKSFRPWAPGWPIETNCPALFVTWKDATEFCTWLSRKEGKTYRLPTEAEWEYACRAGSSSRYCFGDDPEQLVLYGNVADRDRRTRGGTSSLIYTDREGKMSTHDIPFPYLSGRDGYVFAAPVGQFRPNAFGLYDMHGNVAEWCADWFDVNYYEDSPVDDPQGPASGTSHVVRGGDFNNCTISLRCAFRWNVDDEYRCIFPIGFRVVREQ
jgi:formylglycine-generating enzyme required for sulfatase activity